MDINPKRISYNNSIISNKLSKLLEKFSLKAEGETIIDENTELLDDIKKAKSEWICANTGLDYANEEEIIDYNIYRIKACQSKYEYLLRKAKERGLKAQ